MKIKRSIFSELQGQIENQKISLLVGPRQVGKTFLLSQLSDFAINQKLRTRFFDLEQPEDLLSFGSTEKIQLESLASGGDVIFIDELHYIKNISKLFKALHDRRKGPKVFASGSSALELHKHLKESMAGRIIMNRIFPLGQGELMQNPAFKADDFFRFGGLPGLINLDTENNKVNELQSIVSTYITKDIKGLIKEENIRAFNQLIYLIAENQGDLVVSANLAREIGMSKPTVEKYLEILSQTYVCHQVLSYSKNLGNELKKSKKYYLYDLGIRNSLLKDFRFAKDREDKGKLYESYVFLSLFKQLKPNMEIRFWRTKKGDEVDFIVLKNRIPLPIEVKSNISEPSVPKGIKKFLDNYDKAPGAIVFNDNLKDKIIYKGKTIRFQTFREAENVPYLQEIASSNF
jgi:uncharacterized protein